MLAQHRDQSSDPTPTRRAPAKLSTLFTRHMQSDETPTYPYWRRHLDGDATATAWLFEWYAPLCHIMAVRCLRRSTDPGHSYDDMISDASLGLLNALRLTNGGPHGFGFYAKREIKKSIYRQWQMRMWGGRRGMERASVIREIRAKLTAELGELPSDEQLCQRLRGLVTNPNIAIHGEKQIYSKSQIGKPDRKPVESGRIDAPDRRAIEADMWKLARKTMSAGDVKILKLLLEGHTKAEICRRLNIQSSVATDRFNGVLWLCKSNAKLAEYLGAEAAEAAAMPAKNKQWHYPSFDLVAFRNAVSQKLYADGGRPTRGRSGGRSRQKARVA